MIRSTLFVLAVAGPAVAQLQSPPRAADHNPDPRVVETVLVAAQHDLQLVPGRKTALFVYNGALPGPTIEANLGDRVVVHLVNLLPEPTTIHWHGVETPAAMDGSELSQAAVPSSGHFRYEFVASHAGTFWYHPHANTNEQIERGLYGALLVRDPRHDATLGIPPEREHVVFLDDIKLGADNQLAPFATDPRAEFVSWQRAEDLANSRLGTHQLVNGRVVTAEDLPVLPVEPGKPYRLRFLSASSGHLWRLGVATGAVLFGIGSDQGLWNAAERIEPIGQIKDFRGHHDLLISNPDVRVGITLTPGDRFEAVLVPTGDPGTEVLLESHDYIRGKHVAFRSPRDELLFGHDHFDGAGEKAHLLRLPITGERVAEWRPPAALRHDPIEPLAVDAQQPPLPVFVGHGMPDPVTGSVMFFLQVEQPEALLEAVHKRIFALPIDHQMPGGPDPRAAPAAQTYMPLPMMKLRSRDGYHVRAGETRVFEVVNFTGSDHNLHLHGFAFQHLGTEYVDFDEPVNEKKEPPQRLCYEDTIRVPKQPGLVMGRSYSITRLAVRFDDAARPAALRRRVEELVAGGMAPGVARSGGWMLHCHFLEHGSAGMMTFVAVRP